MLRINQIKLNPGHSEKELKDEIIKTLRIDEKQLISYEIAKKSIDARKGQIKFCYAVNVKIQDEKNKTRKINNKNIMSINPVKYVPSITGNIKEELSPIVTGSGPAGLFCTYMLALYGYKPVLIERGEDVDTRTKTVERFWKTGILKTSSNVQFGEGGAGTFSDGKLNTLVKDKFGRNRFVLETFVKFGAPEEILYINKPHIGTDILSKVVKNMRNEIIKLGGSVRFNTCLTDITISGDRLTEIEVNGSEKLPCSTLVLALGHSSRDTFNMLYQKGLDMESKSFAVGVRVQHPQEMINLSQYKIKNSPYLPAADYKVAANLDSGRGVYSFCMCPGGYVVNASSEPNMLAINGMSYSNRNGNNANSAIIVTVSPKDFNGEGPLSGVEYQRRLESMAYNIAGGNVPVQILKDFKAGHQTVEFGDIEPAIKGKYQKADLRKILPDYISESIIQGMDIFAEKIQGFNRDDTILAGIESRTSSPVRILRDETYQSNVKGIYPCGEGAGYAGGITSAAMDGIKVFDGISAKIKPFS
ncbi:MAG: FAD-dependent oxidoreductase [Lachnospiraceae bacterium]|nr:FAD-dependent oxidoreductase [Lachnospiraceae bacterium]